MFQPVILQTVQYHLCVRVHYFEWMNTSAEHKLPSPYNTNLLFLKKRRFVCILFQHIQIKNKLDSLMFCWTHHSDWKYIFVIQVIVHISVRMLVITWFIHYLTSCTYIAPTNARKLCTTAANEALRTMFMKVHFSTFSVIIWSSSSAMTVGPNVHIVKLLN